MTIILQDDDVFFIANERSERWFPEIKIKRQTSRPFVLSSNGLSGTGSKFPFRMTSDINQLVTNQQLFKIVITQSMLLYHSTNLRKKCKYGNLQPEWSWSPVPIV